MPLRRHAALRSLSRDHHFALLLARGIQSGASPHLRARFPAAPRDLASLVRRVFDDELSAHFEAEECVLFPAIAGRDAALDSLARDIEAEHVEMIRLVDRLGDVRLDGPAIEALLDALGRRLEGHVHAEERLLYERIQETLDEASLRRLGEALDRHLSPCDGCSAAPA
jgi:iron-sulfur cluster repair protein YtfE (RIC family)